MFSNLNINEHDNKLIIKCLENHTSPCLNIGRSLFSDHKTPPYFLLDSIRGH